MPYPFNNGDSVIVHGGCGPYPAVVMSSCKDYFTTNYGSLWEFSQNDGRDRAGGSYYCTHKPSGVAAPVITEEYVSSRSTFAAELDALLKMHQSKGSDYGSQGDPFANYRTARAVGVKPSMSAWLRLREKVGRLDNYFLTGKLANEGVVDSLHDIAGISLIVKLLLDDETKATGS